MGLKKMKSSYNLRKNKDAMSPLNENKKPKLPLWQRLLSGPTPVDLSPTQEPIGAAFIESSARTSVSTGPVSSGWSRASWELRRDPLMALLAPTPSLPE
jgi:hypothetical protein